MKVGWSEGLKGQQKETNRPTAEAGRGVDRNGFGLSGCGLRYRFGNQGKVRWIPGHAVAVIDEFCAVREAVQEGA